MSSKPVTTTVIHHITHSLLLHDFLSYEIMEQCWNDEKKKRPLFSQLKVKLKVLTIKSKRKTGELNENEAEEEEEYTDLN